MKIKIGNNIRVEGASIEVATWCYNHLVLDNPDYINAKRLGRYTGSLEKKIYLYSQVGGTYIIPFGCLLDIYKLKGDAPVELQFHEFWGNSLVGDINLYDYQKRAVESLKSGKNGVLEAPCGSGKTMIGLQLIKELGGRALWLTHTKDLMSQSKIRAQSCFEGDFGEITDGKVKIGKDITFATVQTMAKVDPAEYKDLFDIVVVDEVHHAVGSPTKMGLFYKVISNCNARYKYGLSATLNRADNLIPSMYAIIGNKLHTIHQEEVGDKIIKAKHRKVDVDLEYNLEDYCDMDGTINYGSLITMLSFNKERNDIIIDNVRENLGRKQIILCHRVAQVEELASEISKFTTCSCITGKVKSKSREYESQVIVATYSLAKEGLDIPDLEVLHLATPQKNLSTTQQSVGRIERNIAGKEIPICYDYVDNNIDYCNMCYRQRRRILKRA